MLTKSKWSVFFHDYEDPNWNHESYEKLASITTVVEFWTIFEILKPKLQSGMFFFMKDPLFPRWDADSDIQPYSFMSIKVLKTKVESFAEHIFTRLFAECLHTSHPEVVKGVSVSPKKHFCIFKIWLHEQNYETVVRDEKLYDIPRTYHGSLIYRQS
jgi:hypothetical protein